MDNANVNSCKAEIITELTIPVRAFIHKKRRKSAINGSHHTVVEARNTDLMCHNSLLVNIYA